MRVCRKNLALASELNMNLNSDFNTYLGFCFFFFYLEKRDHAQVMELL